jgi:rhodanese-related sulfurtransferase
MINSLMNSFVRIGVLMGCLLMALPLQATDKPRAPDNIRGAVMVSAEELIKLVFSNPDLVLIDSRKKTEYLKGHIEGAVNILNTHMTPDDLTRLAPDKSAAILFYCNGERCLRSSDAAGKAIEWGYRNVFWFRGGWQEWTQKKFPIITGEYLYLAR